MGKHVRPGMIFGNLTVLEILPGKVLGKPKALCRCACGRSHKTSTVQLTHRKAKRCRSCVSALPPGEAIFRRKFDGYRRAAHYRGRKFDLTLEQFRVLHDSACKYCGVQPAKGADRQDNTVGYVFENCVPCCSTCNYAKRDLTPEQFLSWVARISSFQGFSL